MRPGQNKRMRGRPNNNNNNRRGPNPLTRSYESNGPDVKIRGNAHHIAEKYLQLARDAHTSGDPVAAENNLQHAEHYFRLIATAQAAQLAAQGRPPGEPDPEEEDDDDGGVMDRFASPAERAPPPPPPQPQGQPYVPPPQAGGYYNDRQPYEAERQGQQQPHGERNNFQPRNDRPQQNRGDNRRPQFNERNDNGHRDNRPNQDHRPPREFRPFRDQNPQRDPQPPADAAPAGLPSFITAAPRVPAPSEALDAPQPIIEAVPAMDAAVETPAALAAPGEATDESAQGRGPRGRRRRLRSPYGFQAAEDEPAEPVAPGGNPPSD